MNRKITFTNVGVIKGSRVWRNSETGVEIIKGANFKEVGLYYVCAPTLDKDGRMVVATRSTLAGAREAAKLRVLGWRQVIAQAHLDATLEGEGHAIREANQTEQIATWFERHNITGLTAEVILAAREIDHAEALTEHSSRYWESATSGMPRVPAFG